VGCGPVRGDEPARVFQILHGKWNAGQWSDHFTCSETSIDGVGLVSRAVSVNDDEGVEFVVTRGNIAQHRVRELARRNLAATDRK
jgi:hypothetical protein